MRRDVRRRKWALASNAWRPMSTGIDLDVSMEQIVEDLESFGDDRSPEKSPLGIKASRTRNAG